MNSVELIAPTTSRVSQYGFSASDTKLQLALSGDDFNYYLAATLFALAFLFWLIRDRFNYSYRIKHQQSRHDRLITILQDHRSIAVFKYPAKLRSAIDFALHVPLPVGIYYLVSAKNMQFRFAGLFISMVFVIYILFLIFKSLVHRRSIYHRIRLLFREDPMFMRTQLIFGLFRHFTYLILGLTFISYAIDRIFPSWFIVTGPPLLLFVAHFQSTLNGMTSIGPSYIEGANTRAVLLLSLRTILVYMIYTLFGATVAAALSNETQTREREKRAAKEMNSLLKCGQITKSDVHAIVSLVTEQVVGCSSGSINECSKLHEDLGADMVDVADIQFQLEQIFETGFILESETSKLKSVGDFVTLFWARVEKTKLQNK